LPGSGVFLVASGLVVGPGCTFPRTSPEGYMSGFLSWLEQAVFYIAAVMGLGALSFVAMRLLA
jgi:hypothetical protein